MQVAGHLYPLYASVAAYFAESRGEILMLDHECRIFGCHSVEYAL